MLLHLQTASHMMDKKNYKCMYLECLFAPVLPIIMGNPFASFLWLFLALWDRRLCFSSILKTKKTCGQIFTTANFKGNFPWQLHLKSLEIQNLPISNSKGGHLLLQKA